MYEEHNLCIKPMTSWTLLLRPSEYNEREILVKIHVIYENGKNHGEAMQIKFRKCCFKPWVWWIRSPRRE